MTISVLLESLRVPNAVTLKKEIFNTGYFQFGPRFKKFTISKKFGGVFNESAVLPTEINFVFHGESDKDKQIIQSDIKKTFHGIIKKRNDLGIVQLNKIKKQNDGLETEHVFKRNDEGEYEIEEWLNNNDDFSVMTLEGVHKTNETNF
eukprot:UN31965